MYSAGLVTEDPGRFDRTERTEDAQEETGRRSPRDRSHPQRSRRGALQIHPTEHGTALHESLGRCSAGFEGVEPDADRRDSFRELTGEALEYVLLGVYRIGERVEGDEGALLRRKCDQSRI